MLFRVLPFLIIFMFVLLSSKALDVFESAPDFMKIPKIWAADDKPKEEAAQKDEKKGEEKVSVDDPAKDLGKSGEEKESLDLEKSEAKQEEKDVVDLTPIEIEVLQSLTKRREELERREDEISLKENTLRAIEINIDKKIIELKGLQKEITKILAQYEERENEKIKSLVKVYESMKPKDAAKIFEQLQMSILLDVADNMKETKLAQILAKMDSYKAKEVTVELANRRRVKR